MKRTCVRYILFVLLSCIVLASSEPKEEAFEEASELKPNSFGAVDLVDMKYIYEIWEPEIAEVAQVMFEQLKKSNKKVELLNVDKDNAQVANGVYYRVKIELDKGQQIEFSMLDFGRPHYMWIESDDPDLSVLSELKPIFPRMEFQGPLELHLPARREVNMKVPRNVDSGTIKKIILDKNAAVNASGFIEISLHQPLTLSKLALVNGVMDPSALQQLAGFDIFGKGQNKPTHKLVLSTRNTPHLQLSNERDLQNRIKNFIDGARKPAAVEYGALNFDDSDLHIESETGLKVRRKSIDEVILTGKDGKKPVDTTSGAQSSLIEMEIPINDEVYRNLEELFKQIKMSYPAASIKRILEGQAEAVKCFLIPMHVVDGESEAQWYVMAMRRVTGENVLLNVHKHNVVPRVTMNEALTYNETMEVVNEQIKTLVKLQADDMAEQQKQLPNDKKVTRVTPEGVVEDKKKKRKN